MPDEAKTLEEAEALANQRLDQKIAAWGEAHPAEEA
jgi:hypothetical protein